jgi:UDP-2-acetamido-2,6-beta-L-arabino-hexul-4-ose reductase
MIRIGITGQAGFVGTHLFNTIGLYPDKFERISFEDSFFLSEMVLAEFVSKCDVIVHLAAVNRHNDHKVIYNTNIELVKKVIAACEKVGTKPYIIFSSSTQEEQDSVYGRSKKEGRELFEQWATRNKASFTGLVIPNVFGPFCTPYYNSVVATFCHQLTHNETPHIMVDGEIKLIYVRELVMKILERIELHKGNFPGFIEKIFVPNTDVISVSDLLQKLLDIKAKYFENGILPNIINPFDLNLFNTFLTYIDHKSFYPFILKSNTDSRGSFIEAIKLFSGGQISFSTTMPDVTRGNHFHTRKAERFVVIRGKAEIEIRRIGTNEKHKFELDGKSPSFVDMPVWFTHKITNVGSEELLTIFWINEHYDLSDPDTFLELV